MNDEKPKFDPVQYKQTTLQQWESAAEPWHRWAPLLSKWLGAPTEMMLDMAGVGKGSHVLDVAAGAGDQTMVVANRVGPTGRVLATDLSPSILEFAAMRAREARFDNVETRELDGESLAELEAESFDAAISRVGMIYFPISSVHWPECDMPSRREARWRRWSTPLPNKTSFSLSLSRSSGVGRSSPRRCLGNQVHSA